MSKLTNQEINALVVAYQQGDQDAFTKLYDAVHSMATSVAKTYYKENKGKSHGYSLEEFEAVAISTIFTATLQFDSSKGGNFTSLLKQMIGWAINDEFVKKYYKKSESEFRDCVRLDSPLSNGEGTLLEILEHQIATDFDHVFNQVVEQAEKESNSDFISQVKELVEDFSKTHADDSAIVKIAFSTIMVTDKATSRVVNKALEASFPEVKPATLRKKKQRAFERFTTFAQKKGFNHLNLSQF